MSKGAFLLIVSVITIGICIGLGFLGGFSFFQIHGSSDDRLGMKNRSVVVFQWFLNIVHYLPPYKILNPAQSAGFIF